MYMCSHCIIMIVVTVMENCYGLGALRYDLIIIIQCRQILELYY